MIETYAFNISSDVVSPLNVQVTLKCRSISQPLAKALLGEYAPEIPVIDMVSLSEKISF